MLESGDTQSGQSSGVFGAHPPQGDPAETVGFGQAGPNGEAAGVLVPDGAAVGGVHGPLLLGSVPACGGAGGGGQIVGGSGGEVGGRSRARPAVAVAGNTEEEFVLRDGRFGDGQTGPDPGQAR